MRRPLAVIVVNLKVDPGSAAPYGYADVSEIHAGGIM